MLSEALYENSPDCCSASSSTRPQPEAEEALRTRFSYHEDDLPIVQWDTAFVYDRSESASAIEDILEFANTQLLELRTYDTLLDRELDGIYKIGSEKPARSLRGRREARTGEFNFAGSKSTCSSCASGRATR